jgi:Iap family predicted aminopeptidase
MRDYPGGLRDLVADAAGAAGVPLRRGLRSRNSTDSAVPSRAGYPVATLISINAWKALSNYHWPSDTPENVDYDTLAAAVDVAEATIRALAAS